MGLFWGLGYFDRTLKKRTFGLLGLFAVQAGLGWWMVKSGLKDKEYEGRARVEPVRLMVHKLTGVTLFSGMFWTALGQLRQKPEQLIKSSETLLASLGARRRLIGIFHLALSTLAAGALVAGTDAGKVLNNFPFYGEDWFFPSSAFELTPWYRNFYENKALIQTTHRTLAYITYLYMLEYWLYARSASVLKSTRFGAHGILLFGSYQVLIGIIALMRGCPLHESLTH